MKSIFRTMLISIFLILFPVLFQIIFADNISFRWTHIRWYLFLSIFFVIITTYTKLNKWMAVNFLVIYCVLATSNALIFKVAKGTLLEGEFFWDEISFAMGVVCVVCLSIVFIRQLNYKFTSVLALMELGVILPYVLNVIYAIMEKDIIDVNSLIAMYQTNSKEIAEFLLSSAPIYVYVVIALMFFGIYGFLYYSLFKIEVSKISGKIKSYIVLAVAIVGVGVITNKVVNHAYFLRIYSESKEYLQAVELYNAYRVNDFGEVKNIEAQDVNDLDHETFLVVIGESQNRQHMSAYGYERETTPWLDKMSSDDNFVLMGNGYACHTLTMLSLSQVLTEKSQYNKKPLEKSYSIIDIANAAGYKTYWISNQAQFGSYNTPVTTIVNFANEKIWLNSDSSASRALDENVLDAMKTIPNDGKKIVFIHLYGNHFAYRHRYPSDRFNIFVGDDYPYSVKDIDVVNEYDNSMVYNDYIMENIFNYAKDNWNVASMAYVADHGEAVKSGNKHIPGKYEIDMATIPVYFYFSDEYIANNSKKFNSIKKNRNVSFTNDMMYNMLLNIWGISTPHYDAQEDCFNNQYAYPAERLRILDREKIKQ